MDDKLNMLIDKDGIRTHTLYLHKWMVRDFIFQTTRTLGKVG